MFSVDGAFLCISPALKNPSQDFRCYFWFGFVFLAMSELIFSIFNLVKQQCELVPLDQMNENYETQLKCLCFTKLFASNFLKYYREIFFIGKYFNLFFHFISYSFCKRGFWVQCNACRLFSHFSGEDILSGFCDSQYFKALMLPADHTVNFKKTPISVNLQYITLSRLDNGTN